MVTGKIVLKCRCDTDLCVTLDVWHGRTVYEPVNNYYGCSWDQKIGSLSCSRWETRTLELEDDFEDNDCLFIYTSNWAPSLPAILNIYEFSLTVNGITIFKDVDFQDNIRGARTLLVHINLMMPEPAPYEGFCDVFGFISEKCGELGETFTDLANLGASWWLIDSVTDVLFGRAATLFISLRDFFLVLRDWCIAVTARLNALLDFDAIKAALDGAFSLSELKNWLTTRDDWLAAKLADWDIDLPDWLPTSLDDLKDLIAAQIPDLPDWLPTSLDDLKDLIAEQIPDLPDWLPTSRADLITLIKDTIAEVSTVPENLEAWLDAQIDKYKDKVINWVVDEFFTILDKVFEKEV